MDIRKDILNKAERIVAGRMAEKHLEFVITAPTALGTLMCDDARLLQALVGILNNARKFTPEKGKIALDVVFENSQWIRFSVTDTGCGFEGTGRELFVPLVQKKRVEGGVGLGLAIAKDLIEMMGGSIFASSKGIDCGATFGFLLPLTLEDEGVKTAAAAAPAGEEATPEMADMVQGMRALVVDDSAMLVSILKKQLTSMMEVCGVFVVLRRRCEQIWGWLWRARRTDALHVRL